MYLSVSTENFQEPAKIQSFKTIIKKLCKLEQDFQQEIQILQNYQCESLEKFDEDYKAQLAALQGSQGHSGESQRFLKFVKDIEDLQAIIAPTNGESTGTVLTTNVDGMVMQSQTQITTDPISKRPISDPVRNKICKHIYDKQSIMDAIKVNSRLRCPYVGCNNRKVDPNDLEEDRELKRKFMSLQLKSQNMTMQIDDED